MSDYSERQHVIFKKYLRDLREQDGFWHGYLESEDELKSFERALATANVKYAVRSSREPVTSPKAKIVYSMRIHGSKISVDNTPFRILKDVCKVCIFGVEYYKSTQESQKDQDPDTTKGEKKVRRKSKGTRKKGCPATMYLKWIEIFPDFQVDIPQPCSQVKRKSLKADSIKELRQKLGKTAGTVASKTRIYVQIADPASHDSHGFGEVDGTSQRINEDVARQIETLVKDGITSVIDIKRCLHHFVHDVLFPMKEKPDSSCKAFFPDSVTIKSHIHHVRKKGLISSKGQENADNIARKIQTEHPGSSVLYRPCVANKSTSDNLSNNMEESIGSECEETMLFCFQTNFMKNMLAKYGASVVCLHAAHRTSECASPLFILAVKTAFGYMAAGVFIVQFETAPCIAEALNVFKEWCTDWAPEFWMVDCNQAEMDAIGKTFPESKPFFCDFHRIQAWKKWLRKKENGVLQHHDVLKLMECVSSASSHDEFAAALAILIASEHWENEKFRSYFETDWLSVKELWVFIHRLELGLALATNKGIEALNKVFVLHVTKGTSNSKRSVNSLIIALVYAFLPVCEKKYHDSELRQSLLYKEYSENLPSYLCGRPKEFINHLLQRLVDAEEYTPADVAVLSANGVFLVRSESADEVVHTVDFGKPFCTCLDFAEHDFPCKHFCAIFKLVDGWNFLSLPEDYLNESGIALQEPCVEADETCLSDASTGSPGAVDFVQLEVEVATENPVPESPTPSPSSCPVDLELCRDVSERKNFEVEGTTENVVLESPTPSACPVVTGLRKGIVNEWEKCNLLLDHCCNVETLTEVKVMLESALGKLAESLPDNFALHSEDSMNGRFSPVPLPKRRRLQDS